MNKQTILPVLCAAALIFISACNTKPTADNYLKDDSHRKDIVLAMVHHQPYMTEMMNEMMNNDSCKQMMMDNMMNDPNMKAMHMDKMMNDPNMKAMHIDKMITMCKDDSSLCKMMIDKTMEMCDADPAKCKMMMGSMQSHPTVLKSMKEMGDMDHMKN